MGWILKFCYRALNCAHKCGGEQHKYVTADETAAVTECLMAENTPLIDIHKQMKTVNEQECVDISTVWHWAASVHDRRPKQDSPEHKWQTANIRSMRFTGITLMKSWNRTAIFLSRNKQGRKKKKFHISKCGQWLQIKATKKMCAQWSL